MIDDRETPILVLEDRDSGIKESMMGTERLHYWALISRAKCCLAMKEISLLGGEGEEFRDAKTTIPAALYC